MCSLLAACHVERASLHVPRLPEDRHGHRAEFLDDGRLLVFGGFDDANRSEDRGGRSTWIFDPEHGAWSRTGDLRHAMQFHGSTSANGSVYAVSGDVERFDATAGAWTVVVPGNAMPRSHFAAASMRVNSAEIVAAAGGFQNAIADLGTSAVTALPDYPGRTAQDHFALVAALDGALHVAGGYTGEDFQLHAQHWAWDGTAWSVRAPIPRAISAKYAAWCAEPVTARMYAFDESGGLVYDARTDAWSMLPKPPWTGYIAMPACAMRDGYLYVLGGQVDGGGTGGVCVYDARAGAWIER